MQLVAWCILSAIRKAMVTNSNTRVKVPTSLAGTQPTVETFSNRDNEETSLNPLGRVDSDGQNRGFETISTCALQAFNNGSNHERENNPTEAQTGRTSIQLQ